MRAVYGHGGRAQRSRIVSYSARVGRSGNERDAAIAAQVVAVIGQYVIEFYVGDGRVTIICYGKDKPYTNVWGDSVQMRTRHVI